MKIDIVPEQTAIAWGGGIDDTLGAALLIEQYGADRLNFLCIGKDRHFYNLPSYTNEIIDTLKINRSKLTIIDEDARKNGYPSINYTHPPTEYLMAELATVTYYMVENNFSTYLMFTTEENEVRFRENFQHAKQAHYYIPEDYEHAALAHYLLDNPNEYIKMPFQEADKDRHDVIEMYYEKNIQHLLPLTRSCGVKSKQLAFNNSVHIDIDDVENNIHCGVCPRCLKRKYAFKSYGVSDPTKYIA